MKRKPHIAPFLDFSGRRLWRAKSRPEASNSYVSLTPSGALCLLDKHRRTPILAMRT